MVDKIQELKQKYQLNIQYSNRQNELSHEEILKKFGAAKLAVGNSISDGVPNTLLEAIILGAFPIQSNPGGASEDYIENGKNGILIENSEDENEIANHIKLALNSPELLINAYAINSKKAKKLAYEKVQRKVLDIYKKIADEK
ncbi:glycosyltransferase [Polaribacter tangerinus]|uniref:glycosyltransferase n=1 Tax=Polaribacter tangerinus TaxID=1920034 RepID=UPI001303DBFF|nr:glycosyltransferase [Polaribacter tangerinus]